MKTASRSSKSSTSTTTVRNRKRQERKKARRKNPATEGQRARNYYDNCLRRYKRRVVNNQRMTHRVVDIDKSDYSRACAWIEIICLDPCAYCDAVAQDIDHIVPLHVSGMEGNKWDNFTAACKDCNGRKHNNDLLAFLLGR